MSLKHQFGTPNTISDRVKDAEHKKEIKSVARTIKESISSNVERFHGRKTRELGRADGEGNEKSVKNDVLRPRACKRATIFT